MAQRGTITTNGTEHLRTDNQEVLRSGRRSAAGFERTVENDELANRLRFTAFDEIENAIPSDVVSDVAGHCEEFTDSTSVCFRQGRRKVACTRNQTMKRMAEQ